MMKQLEMIALKIYGFILVIGMICIGASFALSLARVMGHDSCIGKKECIDTPCAPLYIDKLEPMISTRWFCEDTKK